VGWCGGEEKRWCGGEGGGGSYTRARARLSDEMLLPIYTHAHIPHTHASIISADTFTRWRTHYLAHGSFRLDRRGRFTSGFLLRHDDLKLSLTRYLLSRVKKDISISEVRCLPACLPCLPTLTPLTTTHRHVIL